MGDHMDKLFVGKKKYDSCSLLALKCENPTTAASHAVLGRCGICWEV